MELIRALAAFATPPGPDTLTLTALFELPCSPTRAEYDELFLTDLPPYASLYLTPGGTQRDEHSARVAGYWRAMREQPPLEPDHLHAMLDFYARLTELGNEESERARQHAVNRVRVAFLWDQLLTWLPAYLAKLEQIAARPYRYWGRLLWQVLARDAWASVPPAALPRYLRAVPGVADPGVTDLESFVTGILAPVQSGFVLVHGDLVRAARTLQLGAEQNGRSGILHAMLGADRAGTLNWLASEARRWQAYHRQARDLMPAIADFWVGQARATRTLLAALAREAAGVASAATGPAEEAHAQGSTRDARRDPAGCSGGDRTRGEEGPRDPESLHHRVQRDA